MAHDLEAPGTDEHPDWGSIYRARGEEVEPNRPVFTGDVFADLTVQSIGQALQKAVIVLQHPCALRSNGVDLLDRLLVAEVLPSAVIEPNKWITDYYKQMPLTNLRPHHKPANYAAHFTKLHLVAGSDFDVNKRIACMSQKGVNLLFQRWVHHNSRAVIPTNDYNTVVFAQFAEADIIEDWCFERVSATRDRTTATKEAHDWLRGDSGNGKSWQELLKDLQTSSAVETAKGRALKALNLADG